MWFQISKIVHVIGNVLWLGGGAVVAFAYVMLASESAEVRLKAAQALRKLTLFVVTPGMLLSLAGGLTMLLGFWTELYAKAPWAHTKLTVGIIAAGFSGVLTGKLRRAAAGQEVKPGAIRNAGIVLLISAVLGVVLVFTKLGQR
ncbi:MAG: CopD family protein [Polyangiales bacterium]